MGCFHSSPQTVYAPGQPPAGGTASGPNGFSDVIFFPEPSGKMPCHNDAKPGGCHRQNCQYAHGPTQLGRFLHYLRSAKQSLDICVFNITCDEISDTVMMLHKKGVRVRVMTDDDQANSQGSDIQKFRSVGIQVKMDHAPTHMHHKFCVVDGRLLMSGSFNWTRQAVIGNQENVLVTDNSALVTAFRQEFERLWGIFKA